MTSNNRLLCLFAAMVVFRSGAEAYKSGCSGGYCFIISDYTNSSEFLHQSDAQESCQSFGAQLVEIRNKDIQNALANFISSVYRSQGLNSWNVLTNGRRSSGSNWTRLSGNRIGGITVNGQTDSSFLYGYLERTTSGLDLFASRTTYNKGFICSGMSNCSGEVTISGQCYKSFTQMLSWYDARNRCLDQGGDLASFDQITSNAGFKALNGSWINTSNSYWIGFRREWWTWQSSNSDVKYSDWLIGHPRNDKDCLCLSTTQWQWTECSCSQQLPFVCMSESSTTPVADSSQNSNIFASVTKTTSNSPLTITPAANHAETIAQTTGINRGLAVGIGIGIPVIIIIVVLAVITVVSMRRRLKPDNMDILNDVIKEVTVPHNGPTKTDQNVVFSNA